MYMLKNFPVIELRDLSGFNGKDILVCKLSDYRREQRFLNLPHKSGFYQLLLFTEGAGTNCVDFKRFEISPFQIYFLAPGQVQHWDLSEDTDGYVINFSSAFFKTFLLNPGYVQAFSFFDGTLENSVVDLPEELYQDIWHLFRKITEEAKNYNSMGIDMIRALLLQLFISINRIINKKHKESMALSNNHAMIKQFLDLIEKNVSVLKLPREYAQLLFVTPHHLNSICNNYLGRSTGEVIRDRMILEAQRLMFNMDLSISEIAYKLDFNDQSYFSKFFKKYTGQAPDKFRKALIGNRFVDISSAI